MDIFHCIEQRLPLQISRWWNCNRSQLSGRTKPIRAATTLAICANSAQRPLCPPAVSLHRHSSRKHSTKIKINIVYKYGEMEKRAGIVMSRKRGSVARTQRKLVMNWVGMSAVARATRPLRSAATPIMSFIIPRMVARTWIVCTCYIII